MFLLLLFRCISKVPEANVQCDALVGYPRLYLLSDCWQLGINRSTSRHIKCVDQHPSNDQEDDQDARTISSQVTSYPDSTIRMLRLRYMGPSYRGRFKV